MGEAMAVGSIMPKIVGTPEQVCDELERWTDDTGIDGFNLVPIVQPGGFRDFVEMVVPVLQRRGRVRTRYNADTLREHFFGPGQRRLAADHVAHRTLPPWRTAR